MPLSKLWDNETFAELTLPALTTLFAMQLLRVLLPSFVWYLGDSVGISYVTLGVIALGTFLVAFLAAAFRQLLGSHRALLVATGGVGLMRLIEQISTSPVIDLGCAIGGTILFTFFVPLYLMRTRAQGGLIPPRGMQTVNSSDEGVSGQTRKFGRGILLGFVLDTTMHGALGTLDLSWQPGGLATLIVAVLVLAQGWLLLRKPGIPDFPCDASLLDNLPLIALGPLVFVLQVVFQNIARVTTLTGLPSPIAFGLVVLANAIGLAAALLPLVPEGSTVFATLVATGFLAFLTSRPEPLPGAIDLVYFFGSLLLFPFVTLIFGGLTVKPTQRGIWRSTVMNGIGWFLFVLLTLLYYLSYDIRLPFSNTLLPPLAVVLIGLAVLAAMRTMPMMPAASDWTSATTAFALLIIPIGLAINWQSPQPVAGSGFPVRVMTYNLHNGFDINGRLDPEAIAKVIEQAKPDIIGLQEVERGWYIDSSIDLADWLSHRLQMPYVYGATAGRVWGNAILSRYPIKQSGMLPLPPHHLLLRRGVVWARIDVGRGQDLFFIATHFHHIEGDTQIRQQQSPEILKVWNQQPRTIFVGDLNAQPDAQEIEMLRAGGLKDSFAEIGSGDGFTWRADKPDQRIDYVWHSPDLTVRDLVIPSSTASDHLGLAVTVDLK